MCFVIIKKCKVEEDQEINYICEIQTDNSVENQMELITNKKLINLIRNICTSTVDALLNKNHDNDFVRQLCNLKLEHHNNLEYWFDRKIYTTEDEMEHKSINYKTAEEISKTVLLAV